MSNPVSLTTRRGFGRRLLGAALAAIAAPAATLRAMAGLVSPLALPPSARSTWPSEPVPPQLIAAFRTSLLNQVTRESRFQQFIDVGDPGRIITIERTTSGPPPS